MRWEASDKVEAIPKRSRIQVFGEPLLTIISVRNETWGTAERLSPGSASEPLSERRRGFRRGRLGMRDHALVRSLRRLRLFV